MPVPRLGEGAFVGLGLTSPFSTNGAAAQIGVWAPLLAATDSLAFETDDIVLEDLTSRNDLVEGMFFTGQKRVSGTLVLEANYDVMTEFLRMFTGHNVTPSGAGPYTYAFVPVGRDDPTHYALGTTEHAMVIEVFKGGAFANSVFYQGCVPTEIVFGFEPNGFAKMTVSFIGRTATIGAKSTLALSSLPQLATTPTGQASAFIALAGVPFTAFSTTVTLRNGLGLRHDVTAIESLTPVPEGKESSEVAFDIEVPDDTFITAGVGAHALFATPNTVSLARVSPAHSLTFSFGKMKVVGPGEPRPQGPGPVRWSGTMRPVAASITTVGAPAISVINANAAFVL